MKDDDYSVDYCVVAGRQEFMPGLQMQGVVRPGARHGPRRTAGADTSPTRLKNTTLVFVLSV